MRGQTDQTGQINTDNEAVALRRDRDTDGTDAVNYPYSVTHPMGQRAQTGQLSNNACHEKDF